MVRRESILYFIFLTLLVSSYAQVSWLETTQADFADGYLDPNLYASFRINIETGADSGAVEWFSRFDIDLDGYPDFVSPDGSSPYMLRVWFMRPGRTYDSLFFPNGAAGGDCDIADLNIDGYPELIHSGYAANLATIYWNSPTGLSGTDTTKLPNYGGEAIYITDLDKDGYLDILIGGAGTTGTLRIYWGMPGFTYSTSSYSDIPISNAIAHNIECADLDGDNDLDIALVSCNNPYGWYIIENVGWRSFIVHADLLPITRAVTRPHGLSAGDLDNDGDVDLVFTGDASINFSDIFLNEGGWVFTRSTVYPGGCYGGSALYDFDDDDCLDILYFRAGGYLTIYYNDGTGHFSDTDSHLVGTSTSLSASGGTVIDADLDGYVDIFVNNRPSYSYIFWGPDFNTTMSFKVNTDHHGVFREPGDIGGKEPMGVYESNIFDTRFELGICGGYAAWVAYDERDYDSSGELPIPTGSEVVILLRAGITPIPDASWTDWIALTDDSPLPESLMGNRYFQYRAELRYSNPTFLPWLERIEFSFEPCTPIDSVWFWEETDCDGQNLVHLCYISSGGTANINLQMSADSGATWVNPGEEWFTTLFNNDGDYGENIEPATHCFEWLMSEDTLGIESYNWALKVSTEQLLDTFVVMDSVSLAFLPRYGHGLGYGDGFFWIYDFNGGKIYKTPCVACAPVDSFSIERRHNMDIDYEGGYCYYAIDGDHPDRPYRIDVTTLNQEQIATVPDGLTNIQGVHVIGDSLFAMDHDRRHLLLFNLSSPFPITSWDTLLVSPQGFEGIAYGAGYLWGSNNNGYVVQIDLRIPAFIGTHPVPNISSGAEGLCFDGTYLWYQNNQTQRIYQIKLIDENAIEKVAYGPLDSRPPEVNISCPPGSVYVGDTVAFHWTIEDQFWVNDVCTLFISYCDSVETLYTNDTLISWIIPEMTCCPAYLRVAVRDSFCNWGYDSCEFCMLAYPDLWPNNLDLQPPSPIDEGKQITFSGEIFNDNIIDVDEPFEVCVLLNGARIASISIQRLPKNSSEILLWQGPLEEGHYTLCFYADCDSIITESNEANNIACIEFDVYGSECLIFPNPFTPNNDGANDFVVFDYPYMYSERAELCIFDIRNRQVFSKTIGPITSAVEYINHSWNGRDDSDQLLPEGLYIYVIKKEGTVVCNGTVVIAR